MKRLTLQGALRYDHPWSWFPAVDEPASRFFPGASFDKADGVTGYNDITPRMGAAYDLFGNGKTALKANLGKYLQGASVSNLAYGSNPALRIPNGNTDLRRHLRAVRRAVRGGTTDADFVPDCDLLNPLREPGDPVRHRLLRPINNLELRQHADPSARTSIRVCSRGWGVRPSDWSFGVSVQQELFPRASVEVGYYRRTFTHVHHRRHR